VLDLILVCLFVYLGVDSFEIVGFREGDGIPSYVMMVIGLPSG